MAADLPLNLFDCDYENIEWEHDQVTKDRKVFPNRSHKIFVGTIVLRLPRGCGEVPVTYIACLQVALTYVIRTFQKLWTQSAVRYQHPFKHFNRRIKNEERN
jgi:hypothetical protein